ncbi:MAG: hypothetical protein ACREPQ_09800 [Rhodanobacter sp.]
MNASVSAVIRGKAALDEVRDLLEQLAKVDADLESLVTMTQSNTYGPLNVTHDELRSVIQRRRDVITNTLENKGIRIAPDPVLIDVASLSHQEQAA